MGLQLTGDDWRFLAHIPDHSVDTILSCQGVNMWGLPYEGDEFSLGNEIPAGDGLKIVRALNRISKLGAVIRFDDAGQRATEYLTPLLEHNWQIQPHEEMFVARKIL